MGGPLHYLRRRGGLVKHDRFGFAYIFALNYIFALALGCVLFSPCWAQVSPMTIPKPGTVSEAANSFTSFSQLRAQHRASMTAVLDRRGVPVAYVRSNHQALQADWAALEDFSPALLSMVLRSEDQDFAQHWGVDFSALLAALKQNVQGQRRGASTITMQLVGMLDADLRRNGSNQRSMVQKVGQAATALWLERRWSKAEILEAYLNKVPLSGELLGMPMASRVMFGKAAHGLSLEESAILSALLRAPNAAPSLVAKRACLLLKSNQCDLLEGRVRIAMSQAKLPDLGLKSSASHYARYLGKKSPGQVKTTLDAGLQEFTQQALQRHLKELLNRQVEDGAALILDRSSGEVLAWVGSSGTLSDAAQVDFVLAKRQAGSTLKPFLYAQAIEERRLSAASLIDDRPVNLSTAAGLYVPRNYEQQYAGPVSARTALASSLNIPAVRVAVMLTPEKVFQTLNGFGFKLRESGGYFGYSLALGSAEVSLLELAQAYRQLSLLNQTANTQTSANISAASKFIVGDILSDNNARALTFGLHSPLATRGWAAAKTGTSKDMRDNWCVGFTDQYVVAVWVGNASGEPMHRVSGVTGAAPIWAELVNALHRQRPSKAPQPPTGLISQEVQFATEASSTSRQEWFLPGTERGLVATDTGRSEHARITHPVSGTILALDPDIPPERQKLLLKATVPWDFVTWQIDGQVLQASEKSPYQKVASSSGAASSGANSSRAYWFPRPGKHTISLHDREGRMLEKVWVEVRGAQEKPVAKRRR
jgi:penicillin-binding protein 1C